MNKNAVLALEEVSIFFGDNLVLNKVAIQLEPGIIHCLMGYNGSGKSTLAKILGGQCPPTTGKVYFNGEHRPGWNTVEAVAEGVVTISGYSSLFPKETVYENMQYSFVKSGGRFPILTQGGQLKKAIVEFAAKYGIDCTPNTPVIELTNGDRVLLELLRVKLMGAKVLLIDEIDMVLGSKHKKYILELINHFREAGVAILYISHKLDIVRKTADQVSVLQYGRITHFVQRDHFEEDELVEMMFSSSKERLPRIYKAVGEELLCLTWRGKYPYDITLHEGEIVGISGGKVEGEAGLYDVLFSQEKGLTETRIHNKRIRGLRLENALENGIIVMSSALMHLSVFPGYSVRQNMLPYNVVRRVKNEDRRNEICQRYINILNIRTTPSALFETLSLGRQRKVFLAKSILSKGDIFIFDNPTDSIDSVSKIDIYNIINEMKKRGKGIIFVSDDPKEILGIADRVVTMKGNQLTGCFQTGSIGLAQAKLMGLYGREEAEELAEDG